MTTPEALNALAGAKFRVDDEVEAAYIYLDGETLPGGVARTVEVTRHVYVDFAADGRVLGIELLDAKNFPEPLRAALRARAADMQARAEDGAPHPAPSGN